MNEILEVRGLCKRYPAFALDNVSFSLSPGRITGFIGRNGAGKSTTLRSLLGYAQPDAGEVRFFGMDFAAHAGEIKARVGYVSNGMQYYANRRLRAITDVTRRFYPGWDDALYRRYMADFGLDETKTPAMLSNGMKVKYALALALSHRADLLILDEPSSGLDPVSREDLLETFLALRDEGRTLLFSTHITEDLDKCADDILYISGGRIRAHAPLSDFAAGYRLVRWRAGEFTPEQEAKTRGRRREKDGSSALIAAPDAPAFPSATVPDLRDVMVHLESEGV